MSHCGRFQPIAADGYESAALLPSEVGPVEEPELAGALQPVIVIRLELLVLRILILCSSHLIASFSEVFGHVELVVHPLGIRPQILLRRLFSYLALAEEGVEPQNRGSAEPQRLDACPEEDGHLAPRLPLRPGDEG